MSNSGSDTLVDEHDQDHPNFALFRDCLSATLLKPSSAPQSAPKRRRVRRRVKALAGDHPSGSVTAASTTTHPLNSALPSDAPGIRKEEDAEELADFIEYLAIEIFESLPNGLKELDHRSWREDEGLHAEYALPLTLSSMSSLNLPIEIADTLRTYSLISPDPTVDSPLPSSPEAFLIPILTPYIATLTAPPPASYATRPDACEICERDWIPLSYHHLIPRFVHDKAVKRG